MSRGRTSAGGGASPRTRIAGTLAQGQTLTAVLDVPAGLTATITGRQWTRNGAAISGATAATYLLTASDVTPGTEIGCQVSYTLTGASQALTSVPLPVAPAIPVGALMLDGGLLMLDGGQLLVA